MWDKLNHVFHVFQGINFTLHLTNYNFVYFTNVCVCVCLHVCVHAIITLSLFLQLLGLLLNTSRRQMSSHSHLLMSLK